MKELLGRLLRRTRGQDWEDLDRTSSSFFEATYQRTEDPWNFATSPYELSRYDAIIAALGNRRFRRAFEPGCSVGVLTQQLAGHCEEVLGLDFSKTAANRAKERCSHLPMVHIRHGAVPEDIPDGRFDLLVFSEIGYYFEADRLREIGATLVERLEPGGLFVGSHWLGTSPDHVLGGEQVQDLLGELPGLRGCFYERRKEFRLDAWIRE